MSYHDGYAQPRGEGISVVNPLLRIEQKFVKIRELLGDKEKMKDLSGIDLKKLIEDIMQE
mgnify:CR=1 FL=1|tara:strand:- start:755 stop:934 length:180 start_codon:yes stop_codon:yes gene_type:complete